MSKDAPTVATTLTAPMPWQASLLSLWQRAGAGHHAWMLTSPAGNGLPQLARALAGAWLCEAPIDGVACGRCESCVWLTTGVHPDYREIAPQAPEEGSEVLSRQEIKVDAIRALAQWAVSSAHRKSKVVVIDPADAMNLQAANALLKLLEEPPRAVRFILTASDRRRLPATIVSRCVTRAVPIAPELEARAWIASQGIPAAQILPLLAQAGGAPMLALTLADLQWQAQRSQFLSALARPAGLSALAQGDVLDGLARPARRAALSARLDWLCGWMHDLLAVRALGQARYNLDYNTEIEKIAKSIPAVASFRYYANLIERRRVVQHPLNPRLVLEAALIDYKALTSAVAA